MSSLCFSLSITNKVQKKLLSVYLLTASDWLYVGAKLQSTHTQYQDSHHTDLSDMSATVFTSDDILKSDAA